MNVNIESNAIERFIYENLKYIVVISLLVIITIIFFYFRHSYRVPSSNENIIQNYKHMRNENVNHCSKNINSQLCNFYLASSFKPYSSNRNAYDYLDYDTLTHVLRTGVRYIELDLFNSVDNEELVVSTSYKFDNSKLSQNNLSLEKCLKIISGIVFSEELLSNYQDPFFLFLNLNLDKLDKHIDIKLLNKAHEKIKNIFNRFLLPKKYNFQNINIALEPICNLRNKIVIMSNYGFQDSNLDELVNCSLNDSYLKRVTLSELEYKPNNNFDILKETESASITSKIKIDKTLDKYYIKFPEITDLKDIGFNKDDSLYISGTSNNNTGAKLLSIHSIVNNKIIIAPQHILTPEEAEANLKTFKVPETNSVDYLEYNKSNLTILIPDNSISNSSNYDPSLGWDQGCQFVTMSYQTFDQPMKKYINKFSNRSIISKPSNLKFNKIIPKSLSVEDEFPDPLVKDKYDIDYNFFKIAKFGIFIKPINNSNTRLVHDTDTKLTIKYNSTNSNIIVVKGLSGKSNSISFKIGNKYLISKDNCCYLSFKEKSNINGVQFNHDATFYPVKSDSTTKNTFSFQIAKDKIYMESKRNYKGPDYNLKYYIRYKTKFNPNTRIYTKLTANFKKVCQFEVNESKMTVWRPYMLNNFFPLGDICVQDDKLPENKSVLVSGIAEFPTDYELIWNNKGSIANNPISIWRPIPPDGFLSLGYVIKKKYDKPSLKLVKCVGADFTNEIKLGKLVWDNQGSSDKDSLSFWDIPGMNLTLATNSLFKPNEFDVPVYNITNKILNYEDKLYLSKTPGDQDKDTINFIIEEGLIKNDIDLTKYNLPNINNIEDSLENKDTHENKIKTKYKNKNGVYKCINYPAAIWSSIYKKEEKLSIDPQEKTSVEKIVETIQKKVKEQEELLGMKQPDIKDKLEINECMNDVHPGTNWVKYPDNTLRFMNNSKYCLTANLENTMPITTHHGISLDSLNKIYGNNAKNVDKFLKDRHKNVITLQKCKSDKKGQEFSYKWDGSIKYGSFGSSDACLTDSSRGYLRLEDCSKSKQQKWLIKKPNESECITKGTICYVKILIDRGDVSWLSEQSEKVINKKYDENQFHLYAKGEVINSIESYWLVDLVNGDGTKVAKQYTNEITMDIVPLPEKLKKGTRVICRNGGLALNGYEEKHIMWEGIVIKKINNEKYLVLFSVNSIELNSNRNSMGRPRRKDIREILINNIRLANIYSSCD
jgi:hypothetical protein